MKTVYLVESTYIAPGRIYAVFAHEEDAVAFMQTMEDLTETEFQVEARTVFYGQPNVPDFNL